MPSLRNVRQQEAIRAFCRLGGEEKPRNRGRGSHRVVNLNGQNLVIPDGILKIGLLKSLIKLAGVAEDDFLKEL
jgi:predicted RNA binding protein YcfA (HicA-like mRNA interferase family)